MPADFEIVKNTKVVSSRGKDFVLRAGLLFDGKGKTAAKDRDIQIAEVGVWGSPFQPDQAKAAKVKEAVLENLKLADYIHARCSGCCLPAQNRLCSL